MDPHSSTPYRIFTDASADMCPSMLDGLPHVTVLPMPVTFGEHTYAYGPGGDLNVKQFYALEREGQFARTAQINPQGFISAFKPALDSGFDVLYLAMSSGISGTYQSSRLAANELAADYPQRKIICLDTRCASVGQGFLVREAARMQAEGLSIDALAAWVMERRLSVCHWFTVDTFSYLRHGGRVSATAATVGGVLNIKPLLCIATDGTLKVIKKPRGSKQAMRAQLSFMEAQWQEAMGNCVVIGHADAPLDAIDLRDKVEERFPTAQIHIADIGAVIGAHVGPGMLALIYWGSGRP